MRRRRQSSSNRISTGPQPVSAMGCTDLPAYSRAAEARSWNGAPAAIKTTKRARYTPPVLVEGCR